MHFYRSDRVNGSWDGNFSNFYPSAVRNELRDTFDYPFEMIPFSDDHLNLITTAIELGYENG